MAQPILMQKSDSHASGEHPEDYFIRVGTLDSQWDTEFSLFASRDIPARFLRFARSEVYLVGFTQRNNMFIS